MYRLTVMLSEDRKKGRIHREKSMENDDRIELQKNILPMIEELAKKDDFKSPTAEYIIEKDGMYLDGEVDVRVKITRSGVSVKLGSLLI